MSLPPLSEITFDALDDITIDADDCLPFLQVDNDIASVQDVPEDRRKISRGIATLFFEEETPALTSWALDPESYFDDDRERLKNWCGQFERCPTTNKLHIHIAFELKEQTRFQFIRDAFSKPKQVVRINIKNGRGHSQHAKQCTVNYCLDPAKRAEAPWDTPFVWIHNQSHWAFSQECADKQKASKTTKKDVIKEKIQMIDSFPSWMTWEEIIHSSDEAKELFFGCSASERYHKTRHAVQPRRTIETVEIHFGAGGTGKTTYAKQLGDAIGSDSGRHERYVRNYDDGAFWGGGMTKYGGQAVIHLEEFEGQETLSKLKEICDLGSVGPNVNVKNGGTRLNHSHVIITSNTHPAGFYRGVWGDDPKQFAPFWRRVTKVVFYPSHLADGSLNAPSCDEEVYCIDQTDEWKTIQGDYEQALKMAARDWPLKDETTTRNYDDAFVPGFNLPTMEEMPKLKRTKRCHNLFEYAMTAKDPTTK